MKKIYLISLPILLISIYISHNTGFKKALKTNEEYKKEVIKETLKNNPVPECESCTTCDMQTFDADGDGWGNNETVIIESVGMSQFAGRVIIIDEGKIIFTSKEEMRIRVYPIRNYDYNTGFFISYSTEPNSNTAIVNDFYKFINGKFKIVKTIDKDTPRVTYYAKLESTSRVGTNFYRYDMENKKIIEKDKEKVSFSASPSYIYGDNDSKKWNEMINSNKDSIFKITGISSDMHCSDEYDEICTENIFVDDIEVIK